MSLNIQNTNLKMTAGFASQFPRDAIPQVALSGRSNVGKSSLINTLLGRKSLARVSATPGKTNEHTYNLKKFARSNQGTCLNQIPSVVEGQKVSAGDVIEIREKSKSSQRYKDIVEVTGGRLVPAWLESNQEALSGTVKEVPTREQIDVPVNETLIVELYSK